MSERVTPTPHPSLLERADLGLGSRTLIPKGSANESRRLHHPSLREGWWTRSHRIRTAAEVPFQAALLEITQAPAYERIASQAKHLRGLETWGLACLGSPITLASPTKRWPRVSRGCTGGLSCTVSSRALTDDWEGSPRRHSDWRTSMTSPTTLISPSGTSRRMIGANSRFSGSKRTSAWRHGPVPSGSFSLR